MAVRIVYVLDNKSPDIVKSAESWIFRDGTLKILDGPLGAGKTKLLVEIREDFVLSVEHINLHGSAKEAPKGAPEPKKATKGAEKV